MFDLFDSNHKTSAEETPDGAQQYTSHRNTEEGVKKTKYFAACGRRQEMSVTYGCDDCRREEKRIMKIPVLVRQYSPLIDQIHIPGHQILVDHILEFLNSCVDSQV